MEKLKNSDIEKLKNYISKEAEYNIFILGDIENFGLEGEIVEVFANEKNGEYDSILLRYLSSYLVYSQKEDYDAERLWKFLEDKEKDIISGKGSIIDRLIPYVRAECSRDYLSKLTQVKHRGSVPEGMKLRELNAEDAEDIVDLLILTEEFKMYTKEKREKLIKEKEKVLRLGADKALGIFSGNRLVSIFQISGENSISAMVVGVATHPEYRERGLAGTLVAAGCQQCLDRGMEFLCLFYDNPAAGSIYRKIGFKEIGKYSMLRF